MDIVELLHKHTKSYLIRNKKEWVMIDAGWPDSAKAFTSIMRERGISFKDIKYLCVTHFHPDHAGLTQLIKENGATLLLHECQKNSVQEINHFFSKHPDKEYRPIDIKGNRILTSLESRLVLKEVGIDGEMIPTPGHSEDSVSIIVNGLCAFTGDLPSLEIAEAYNNPAIKESWRRICEYNVSYAYPAHGNRYEIIR